MLNEPQARGRSLIRSEDAIQVGGGAESAVLGFALFHQHRYTLLDEAQTGPERLEMLRLTQDGGFDITSSIPDSRASGHEMKRRTHMRGLLTLSLIFAGSAAVAHPGHWADLAGHDHWVAGAAIGLAGLAAIWGALKGKKAKEEPVEAEDDLEEETA